MIFGLFRSTEEQERINNEYDAWREVNPDNPSDDDFYFECGYEDQDSDDLDLDDDDDDSRKGWFGLW